MYGLGEAVTERAKLGLILAAASSILDIFGAVEEYNENAARLAAAESQATVLIESPKVMPLDEPLDKLPDFPDDLNDWDIRS
ncbi:hypothetical protein [Actinopolymorpha alba]|uniref:hypothetical protein n=1 Tax=Actinopolymorpha alba TaxID=533267 RepID=UPI0012F6AAFF|nr:hypothetical protein [Actinopolymorpha alba]